MPGGGSEKTLMWEAEGVPESPCTRCGGQEESSAELKEPPPPATRVHWRAAEQEDWARDWPRS